MTTPTSTEARTGHIARPGEDKSFSLLGIAIRPVVTAADSRGNLTLLEQVVPPGAGSPPHILNHGDKAIYVVRGEFAVLLGEKTVAATAGMCVFIPEGVIHNFKNVGTEPGTILVAVSPGGHEAFLEDASEATKQAPPSKELMNAVGSRHGVQMV